MNTKTTDVLVLGAGPGGMSAAVAAAQQGAAVTVLEALGEIGGNAIWSTGYMAFVDTDLGRCHVTRRSTSGGVAMRGNHCIKHWSTTQSTVALSSGEAELGGICRGASIGLCLQSLALDL